MKTQPETNTETSVNSVDETIKISGEQFKQALTAESNKRITDFTNKVNQTIQGDEQDQDISLKLENDILKIKNKILKNKYEILKNEDSITFAVGFAAGIFTALTIFRLYKIIALKRNS